MEHPGIGVPSSTTPASSSQSVPAVASDSGTKRTASKQSARSGSKVEPDAKRTRDGMQLCNIEAFEFYSVPRITPKLVGKYVKSGLSFDIAQPNQNGEFWDFTKSEHR